jgi:hypothetical protein
MHQILRESIMKVYQTDNEGFYVGPNIADPDPLVPGEWIIPGGCIIEEPPEIRPGQKAQWSGSFWIILDQEPTHEQQPTPMPEPTLDEINISIKYRRQATFQQEADPLFFKWQAGESTEDAWLAKRQEIRERYPYQEVIT